MNLEGAEAVVAAAEGDGRDPRRGAPDALPRRSGHADGASGSRRARSGSHSVQGRFFIHRLQNVGATGLQRSWTDNLLWHHTTHLVDFGLWMVSGGDLATAEERIRNVYSRLPADRAAHRDPDGAGARRRDPRRPDDRCNRLLLLARVHLRRPASSPTATDYRVDELTLADHHRRGRAADRHRAGERRADRAGLRRGGPRGSRAVRARAGRCCRPCGCCTACRSSGTPGTASSMLPGRPVT